MNIKEKLTDDTIVPAMGKPDLEEKFLNCLHVSCNNLSSAKSAVIAAMGWEELRTVL